MVTFSDISDYRDFLKEYYDRRKAEMPFYSYRMMGDKLGLDSSYLYRVLQKKQHLPAHALPAAKEILNLSGREAEYFDLLFSAAVTKDKNKREELMESTKNEVMSMLKQQIRPEFLNRIDEIIMFSPLNEDQIRDIVRMQVDGIIRMLSESGIQMRLTDDAIAFLGKAGFDPEFGARPVKRAIQRYLLNDLSKKILSGEVNKEHEIVVDATGEGLRFSN